jgi:spore coat protein A
VKNAAPPAPVSTPAPSLTAVMQIRVGTQVTQPGPGTIPASLPGASANLPAADTTRFITLNEVGAETPGWYLNLNGVHFGGDTLTPRVGAVEDWVFVNLTEDTHPMHTHLVMHQVISRTPFDADAYRAAYGGPDGVVGGLDPRPFATGPAMPPDPTERGFKDTTKVNPGHFTTVRARFDLPASATAPQTYVYHCHIVEHEDNDMMQSFTVTP